MICSGAHDRKERKELFLVKFYSLFQQRNDEIESPQHGSQQQQQHRLSISTLAHGGCLPELLLSLSYNSVVGRLSVEIVKGSHFRNLVHSKPLGKSWNIWYGMVDVMT